MPTLFLTVKILLNSPRTLPEFETHGVRMVLTSYFNSFKLIQMDSHELNAVQYLFLVTNQGDSNMLDISARE